MQRTLLGTWVVCLYTCAALGCGGEESCPGQVIVEAHPENIPSGYDETDITVHVEAEDPSDSRVPVTTLYAETGTFEDVHASRTTYTCDPDSPGVVRVCVEAAWVDGRAAMSLREDAAVGSSSEYVRGPHIRDRPECGGIDCIDVVCPSGVCPEFQQIQVQPTTQSLGHMIEVLTTIRGGGGNHAEVNVDSDCGTVADPIKIGQSRTAVACEVLGVCRITVWLTDDRYAYCTGMGPRQTASFRVYCQRDEN